MRILAFALLLVTCGSPRPVALPAEPIELLVPIEDHSAVVFLGGGRGRGWLARIDSDGRPRWVRPVPEFLATMGTHAPEATRIVADAEHGALRLVDFAASDGPVEHWLGFSLLDGAMRWHAHDAHTLGAEVWVDHGILLDDHVADDEQTLVIRDLATGAPGSTLRSPRPPIDPPWLRPQVHGELIALSDPSRGVALRRTSDGSLRGALALGGGFCRIDDTLVGLRDDDVLAHDLIHRAAPRVIGEDLHNVVSAWLDQTLVGCHRLGEQTALAFFDGEVTTVVALAADRRPSIALRRYGRFALADRLGAAVPVIAGKELALLPLDPRDDDARRRLEPTIHPVTYAAIEPFADGYLAWHAGEAGLDLLSIDIDGEVTGAARVLGTTPEVTPAQGRDGALWLVGEQAQDGAVPVLVLELHTLRPLAGTAFTIVDRTAEAQAAWLPPSSEARSWRRPWSLEEHLPRPGPGFVAPPWPLAPREASARALGITDPLELLAWFQEQNSALFVAHGVDAEGPRWTFVGLTADTSGVWTDAFASDPQARVVLRRRPTRTDLERRLRLLGRNFKFRLGADPPRFQIDPHRYVALTGSEPRRGSHAANW